MLITQIDLENIKSYRKVSIEFRQGTTAISGANGAGKTTIVEAIGFALFDSLPYSQADFVREGEKSGTITIHVIGKDGRPYIVERRCGSGAFWRVFDAEASYRVEQRADVQTKLYELMGIERDRSLKRLFEDAIGVPQGRFTTNFMLNTSERKKTFDVLFQIEDYTTASNYLLEAQKTYTQQKIEQDKKIVSLDHETRDLETDRSRLAEIRHQEQEYVNRQTDLVTLLNQQNQRKADLNNQREQLLTLENNYKLSLRDERAAQQQLEDRLTALNTAREAQELVEANCAGYLQYQRSQDTLKELHQKERERETLRQQETEIRGELRTASARLNFIEEQLRAVATSQKKIIELIPLVDQQVQLESQKERAITRVTLFNQLQQEFRKVSSAQKQSSQQQEVLERRITEIEPLQPLAALLTERSTHVTQMESRLATREAQQRTLQDRQQQLRQKQDDRANISKRLENVQIRIARLEEHRNKAERFPLLQQEYQQISEQRFRLEGNIEGYERARRELADSLCPFLREPCLNVERRGQQNLDVYFNTLLAEERQQLDKITNKHQDLAEKVERYRKFVQELENIRSYQEQEENFRESLNQLDADLLQVGKEVEKVSSDLEELRTVELKLQQSKADYEKSRQADQRVRELDKLRTQLNTAQEQYKEREVEIEGLRKQAQDLKGCHEEQAQLEQQLQALNDPRAQRQIEQDTINREPDLREQQNQEKRLQQKQSQELKALQIGLQAFSQLDTRLLEQESLTQKSYPAYQIYMQNQNVASEINERLSAYEQAQKQADEQQVLRQQAEQAHQRANAAFSQEELNTLTAHIDGLIKQQQELNGNIHAIQGDIQRLEAKIARAERFLSDLETARQEMNRLDDLEKTMKNFRDLIKEAAPHILKEILNDVSASANRIFGEIMGDRSAHLTWGEDYEVSLNRQGVNRKFYQLSGGEQMSAALSIRLALLKTLSSLNIAFFDEPTQNMDEARRTNLAEQIKRVRGFEQLIVISHDDTFEQGLDSLVRLKKENGETRLVSEEEVLSENQVQIYAS